MSLFYSEAHFLRTFLKASYLKCIHPYGQPVKALLLVEGWHIGYLMSLVGVGVMISLVVVAIVTLAMKYIDTGLAAGSYSIGIASVLLGLFTVLSYIL